MASKKITFRELKNLLKQIIKEEQETIMNSGEEKIKELFIVRGIPGSGKSTMAKKLGGVHFEADMFFITKDGEYKFDPKRIKLAHVWCIKSVEDAMVNDNPRIVVSNTFTEEWEFLKYEELAKEYGYTVFHLVVENRHGGKNSHSVPDEVIKNMVNRFKVKLI